MQIPHVPPSLTTLGLLRPLAAALTASGFATWNVEFRRLGNGGGWPTTYADLGTAVDRLRELAPAYHLDLTHAPPSAAGLLPIGVRQEIFSTGAFGIGWSGRQREPASLRRCGPFRRDRPAIGSVAGDLEGREIVRMRPIGPIGLKSSSLPP